MNEKEQSINISFTKRDEVFKTFCLELENINLKYYEIGITLDEDDWGECLYIRHNNIEKIINDKKVLKKVLKLINKYERLLNITCDYCGKKLDYHTCRADLCNKCYFILQVNDNYKDIDERGFSYVAYFDGEERSRRKILWNNIEKAELIKDIPTGYSHLRTPVFEIVLTYKKNKCTKYFSGEIEVNISKIFLYSFIENFYTLLKSIPNKLLNAEDIKIKETFLNNLKDCKICGYKGIFENNEYCIVCDSSHCNELTERLRKRYSTIEEINKEAQLDYYVKLKNKYHYPRLENQFNKSENYKKAVTEKEIEEYYKKNC